MIKKLLLSSVFCMSYMHMYAQTPFITTNSVDINNINAAVLVHGDMWWDPTTGLARCFFPNGAPTSISFAGSIWMAGYDDAGKLHTAAQTYRQTGNDYWPGPLDGSDTLTYATSETWAKIWKVNRTDIQSFLALPVHDTTNTPIDILTWPGAGNIYARGNFNAPLTLYPGNTYAPFVDLNGNGIYEPLLGEYPDIIADQALWWIFSDNGPSHGCSNGRPLGIEIQAMAYAYSRGTLIDNVIYYKYHIINHSANTYHNLRFGQWDDVDLGYYDDDFIGFDSSHRMEIVYNGYPCDGCSGGRPVNSYGYKIPVAGVTMIVSPGDLPPVYEPAGAFDYYNNDFSVIGNPITDSQFNCLLRAEIYNGAHFSDDFQGPGIPSPGYGSGTPTNYVFTGDPGNDTSWNECTVDDNPGDRRFVLASNDFTMLPGASNDIVLALVTTNPDSMNGCPDVSFDSIKIFADTAWATYFNPLPATAVAKIVASNKISIYPNPAHNQLYITNTGNQFSNYSITIFNVLGQLMTVRESLSNTVSTIDISQLLPGIYYVQYRNGEQLLNQQFRKE